MLVVSEDIVEDSSILFDRDVVDNVDLGSDFVEQLWTLAEKLVNVRGLEDFFVLALRVVLIVKILYVFLLFFYFFQDFLFVELGFLFL